jgi:glycosyltransferase involved in cell wall biosynthesis
MASQNLETTLRGFQIANKKIREIIFLLFKKIIIVGDGPSKPFLVKEARDLGIGDKVLFVGGVPHDNLREYYSSCDVFLSPALSESWGLTPLEAMACEARYSSGRRRFSQVH